MTEANITSYHPLHPLATGAGDHNVSPCTTILGERGYLLLLKHVFAVSYQALNVRPDTVCLDVQPFLCYAVVYRGHTFLLAPRLAGVICVPSISTVGFGHS